MIYIAKHQSTQYYVYKLHSSRLKKAKWKLSLPLEQARENDEDIIQLSSSQCLRFIEEINHTEDSDIRAKRIRKKIRELKNEENSSKQLISSLYDALYKTRFIEDYVCIVFDTSKDFDYCTSNGFEINGIHYNPFIGTTGGLKNSVVIFVSDKVFDILNEKKECGRNKDIPNIPEKLSAYEALMCSGSEVVSFPKGIIVVKDCITTFTEPCYNLDDSNSPEPIDTFIKDREFELNVTDGEGLMLPSLAKRWNIELGGKPGEILPAGNIRGIPFTKGMVFCMDYIKFGDQIGRYEVIDAWGDIRDIRDSELILTTSMVKLWDSYSSMEDFSENMEKYNYKCALAKIAEQNCDEERTLNYQFLQSYKLTDDQIKELCQPTIDELKGVLGLDYRKTILFLRGQFLTERNVLNNNVAPWVQALLVEPNMINDPYIRKKVYNLIKKRIQEAKIGKIKVKGNFSIIAGDPYMLMESMFDLEPKGLLKSGEIYHKHWIDRDVLKVAGFRAPMTSHYNIRVLNVVNNTKTEDWYQYLPSICILNGWDTTAEALNGCDKDGDLIFTTNNKVLVDNYRPLPTICCIQRKGVKRIVNQNDILTSYKRAFGDKIGFITNIITSQITQQWGFSPDSEEYKVLDYRIKCGQLYQQNAIDSLKGIEVKPMPLYWYRRQESNIKDTDTPEEIKEKQFNKRIVADKKPYFMIYIYPHIMKEYKDYEKNVENKCIIQLGISLSELKEKAATSSLLPEELDFYTYYKKFLPVNTNPCVVNRICRLFEQEFDGYVKNNPPEVPFDYTKLKKGIKYSNSMYYKIRKICLDYNKWLKAISIKKAKERIDEFDSYLMFMNKNIYFEQLLMKICPNIDLLCDILLDFYYQSNKTKELVWGMVGNVIVERLTHLNWGQVSYPTLSENAEVEYQGNSFSMNTVKLLPSNYEEIHLSEEDY